MSRVLTDKRRVGVYIVSEANGAYRSRETVLFEVGAVIEPGTVLKLGEDDGYVPVEADGAGAVAIAYGHYDASEVVVRGVASVRDMEANGHELVWPEAITDAAKATAIAGLAAVGIIVRF